MGTCLSTVTKKLPENVFSVRNIHGDSSQFPKGIIEVTAVELIYTDAKSRDRWVWPLKYLRKYGCDRDIFSFEAGRKCPGGEGFYAFSTKKAAQLFEMVARNINVGGLLPENERGALSPQSNSHANSHSPISPIPPTLPLPVPASNPPSLPPTHPPYQNVQYQNGQHTPAAKNASESPPLLPPQHSTTPPPSLASAPPLENNYMNVSPATQTHQITSSLSRSASLPQVSSNPMAAYANLDLPSTPKARQATNNTPVPSSSRDSLEHVEVTSSDHKRLEDDKVPYGILDFRTMEALRKTAEERQQDLQEREEEKKREVEKRQKEEDERRAKSQKKKEKKKIEYRHSHN